eukprot:3853457-Rhodomonas_salina.1
MKAFKKKKAEWGPASLAALESMHHSEDYDLEPEAFQTRFQVVMQRVVERGVELVGMTSGSTNRL